jgi:hypothetical protein
MNGDQKNGFNQAPPLNNMLTPNMQEARNHYGNENQNIDIKYQNRSK